MIQSHSNGSLTDPLLQSTHNIRQQSNQNGQNNTLTERELNQENPYRLTAYRFPAIPPRKHGESIITSSSWLSTAKACYQALPTSLEKLKKNKTLVTLITVCIWLGAVRSAVNALYLGARLEYSGTDIGSVDKNLTALFNYSSPLHALESFITLLLVSATYIANIYIGSFFFLPTLGMILYVLFPELFSIFTSACQMLIKSLYQLSLSCKQSLPCFYDDGTNDLSMGETELSNYVSNTTDETSRSNILLEASKNPATKNRSILKQAEKNNKPFKSPLLLIFILAGGALASPMFLINEALAQAALGEFDVTLTQWYGGSKDANLDAEITVGILFWLDIIMNFCSRLTGSIRLITNLYLWLPLINDKLMAIKPWADGMISGINCLGSHLGVYWLIRNCFGTGFTEIPKLNLDKYDEIKQLLIFQSDLNRYLYKLPVEDARYVINDYPISQHPDKLARLEHRFYKKLQEKNITPCFGNDPELARKQLFYGTMACLSIFIFYNVVRIGAVELDWPDNFFDLVLYALSNVFYYAYAIPKAPLLMEKLADIFSHAFSAKLAKRLEYTIYVISFLSLGNMAAVGMQQGLSGMYAPLPKWLGTAIFTTVGGFGSAFCNLLGLVDGISSYEFIDKRSYGNPKLPCTDPDPNDATQTPDVDYSDMRIRPYEGYNDSKTMDQHMKDINKHIDDINARARQRPDNKANNIALNKAADVQLRMHGYFNDINNRDTNEEIGCIEPESPPFYDGGYEAPNLSSNRNSHYHRDNVPLIPTNEHNSNSLDI